MKQIIYVILLLTISSCVDEFIAKDEIINLKEVENIASEKVVPITKSLEKFQEQSYTDYPFTREDDSLYIESMGWKISKMYEDSISYLINGELLFLKESLLDRRFSVQERLYGNTIHLDFQHILFEINKNSNLDISAPSYFSDAINEWNSLNGCNLYFGISGQYKYNTSGWFKVTAEIGPNNNYNADIIKELEFGIMIVPTSSTDNNVPASYMYINPDHENFKRLSESKKKYAIMHAIGHLIKLQDADTSDDLITDGMWNERSYTIMNKNYFLDDMYNCTGFSGYDKDDLAEVYPIRTSVIHGVNQIKTYDSQIPSLDLKQYKTYEFSSEPLGPKIGQENLYYEYEISGPADDYSISVVNDKTVRITFNTIGTYSISARLKSNDIDGLDILSNTIVYKVINNALYLPKVNDIALNKPFNVQWIYADANYPDAEIEVTGEEYLFGDGAENIDIKSFFNGKVSVTLSEYGCYRITLKAQTPTGQTLKVRSFLIGEFWNPNIWVVQNGTNFPFNPNFTKKYSDAISEHPMDSNLTANGPGEYIITIGGNYSGLQHNFYADLYMSYLRQYEEYGMADRRLDVRLVTEDAPFGSIKRNAGSTKVTYGPLKPVIITGLSGSCGVPQSAWANYYGHQTIIVPTDYIKLE